MADQELLYFDDFFADPNATVPVTFTAQGREVTVTVKKVMGADDFAAAQNAGLKLRLNPVTNKPEVVSMDNGAAAVEMLTRAIVSWPFVFRETGVPVPPTREYIKKFCGDGAGELGAKIQALYNAVTETTDAAVDGPFAPPSDAG